MLYVDVSNSVKNGFPSKWIARQFEEILLGSINGSSSVCFSIMEIDDRSAKAIAVLTSSKKSEVLFLGSYESCEYFVELLMEEWG